MVTASPFIKIHSVIKSILLNSYAPRLLDGKLVIALLIVVNVIGLYGPVTTCLLFCNCDKGFGLERFCFYVAKNSCGFRRKNFPYRIPLFM